MLILLDSFLTGMGNELLLSFGSAVVSLVGGYIIIRERILKTELRLNSMTEYIDRKNELIENKIKDLQSDISEFKEMNKEMSRLLNENTTAIRELRVVMDMMREQLGVKGARKLRNTSREDDQI